MSVGDLLPGFELKDLMMGVSACRDPHLANVFYRLQLIEAYGTGMRKIMRAYAGAPPAANHGHEQRIRNRPAQRELHGNGSKRACIK